MQNDLLPLDGPVHEIAVFDISADDPNRVAGPPVEEGEIADERPRVVSNHGGDRGPCRHERLDEVAADEATGPGHYDFLTDPHEVSFRSGLWPFADADISRYVIIPAQNIQASCNVRSRSGARRRGSISQRGVVGDECMIMQPRQLAQQDGESQRNVVAAAIMLP